MRYILLSIFLLKSNLSSAITQAEIEKHIFGNWCANTEEYDGEVSVDGTKWTFNKDGTYVYVSNYGAVDKFAIDGDTLNISNFGKMKVLSISEKEMKGKIYSTYHFTKDKCLPIVNQGVQITKLSNLILMKKIDEVKMLVESGVDINAKDTRTSSRNTPFMSAVQHSTIEIIRFLITKNPDLNIKNEYGRNALDIAKKRNDLEIIKLLESIK